MISYDEDVYKCLKKSLTLKTERGLRASIKRLCIQMERDKESLDDIDINAYTYQDASLDFLRNMYIGINKSLNINTIY